MSGKADNMSQPGMTEKERGELQRHEDALKIPCSAHETSGRTGQYRERFSEQRAMRWRTWGSDQTWEETDRNRARVGTRACSLTDLTTLDVSGEAGTGPPLSKDVRPDPQRWRGRGRTTASVKPPGERKVQPFPR